MSLADLAKSLHKQATERFSGQPIVYHHVPKCGGTSVARALRRAYILSHAGVRPEEAIRAFNRWQAANGASLNDVWAFRELMFLYFLYCDKRCVAGHAPFSDVAFDTFSERYAFVTVLRDPVERFVSNFYWNKSRPVGDRRIEESFDEFLDSEQAARLGSTYVRYFCGHSGAERFTAKDVDRSIHNLRRLSCVGFTDDMGRFEQSLRGLTGKRLNIGKENVRHTSDKYQAILSGPLREKVLAACAADRAIWDAVQDLRNPSAPASAARAG